MISLPLVYEDQDIFLLDKPPNLIVNNAESVKDTETIQNWATEKLFFEIQKDPSLEFSKRAGIVHRLDKETSGLLLVAKNNQSFLNLQLQFKNRVIQKKYLTLVHGLLEKKSGTINAPIGRLPWNRMRFGVFPGGREAKTDYTVMENYYLNEDHQEKFSYLEILLHTGRTHQIRVHLKYLDHCVVGDALYSGRITSRKARIFCPRQFLHAFYLSFIHPKSGKKMEFKSLLPDDLQKVLCQLTKI